MFFSNPSVAIAKDTNKIFKNKDQGIPDKDLLIFEEYADNQNVILLFRPVEPLTKILHEAGTYPTKDFKIKGKTSSWGLWAGFIPVDQRFSKLINTNTETIQKANKEIQVCINQGHALMIHLTIPEKYFEYLKRTKGYFPSTTTARLSSYSLPSSSS